MGPLETPPSSLQSPEPPCRANFQQGGDIPQSPIRGSQGSHYTGAKAKAWMSREFTQDSPFAYNSRAQGVGPPRGHVSSLGFAYFKCYVSLQKALSQGYLC